MLEDRRMYDGAVVERFASHPNPLHRQRIALALGRIAPHSFGDANANGQRDPAEVPAGLDVLERLSRDSDRSVRETTAFALGEIGDGSAADALFLMAGDSDASVAAEAVEAFSKVSASQQVHRHAALTIEKPEGVRARAVRFLFRHNSDAASELATSYLGATEESIRREAAYALSRRAYAPARARLELMLTERDVLTRSYAVTALGRIAAPESFAPLFPRLGDAHPWVRTNAAVALARIAEKDRTQIKAEDLPRMIALVEDPDPGTRANAIELLGYYARANRTALDRLKTLAANGSRWERELAAAALARQFADERPELIPTQLTDWGKVRLLEATAAMRHGVQVRRSLAGDPSAMVRSNVISSIPEGARGAESDIIRAGLADADVMVRASALDALRGTSLTRDEQLTLLGEAEERERAEPLNDARLSAIRAFAEIESGGRELFLRSLVMDKDPVVRRIVSDLIVEKLKQARPQFTPFETSRTIDDYRRIVEWSRGTHTATIHMTRGTIDLKLLTADAPLTTWNFAELAKRGYFDNTTFMRVVPNFVVQSGDPRNDQNGGPGYSIRDEINLQKYTRGAVGMALSGPDTGGSQYFITHSPQPHLDGGYTVFARVSDGMTGVVDQIERGDLVQTIRIDEQQGGDEDASLLEDDLLVIASRTAQ